MLIRDAEEQLGGDLVNRIRSSSRYMRRLRDECPSMQLHSHNTALYCSVFRFDDEMFVTPHLFGRPGWESPLLHLRRLGPSGIFASYSRHFEDVWATSQPMD